jgi:hypothetical protein
MSNDEMPVLDDGPSIVGPDSAPSTVGPGTTHQGWHSIECICGATYFGTNAECRQWDEQHHTNHQPPHTYAQHITHPN